jgi:hypothetical protein
MAILLEASKSNAERTFPAGWGIAPPAAANKAESQQKSVNKDIYDSKGDIMKYSRYSVKVMGLFIMLSALLITTSNSTAQSLVCRNRCQRQYSACTMRCSGYSESVRIVCLLICSNSRNDCLEACSKSN